jgi:hypothetical protein
VGEVAKVAEEATTLYRAVKSEELADIQQVEVFVNRGSAEGKYFSTPAEGAASYAKQAFYGFNDPPYTLVKTEVPTNTLSLLKILMVDGDVPAVVVPDDSLLGLTPEILDYSPIPPQSRR